MFHFFFSILILLLNKDITSFEDMLKTFLISNLFSHIQVFCLG